MKQNLRRGDFFWKDNKRDAEVGFKFNENGKHLVIWKPNLLQRLLIWLKIIKDPRYNGSKVNHSLMDEAGSWPTNFKWCDKKRI